MVRIEELNKNECLKYIVHLQYMDIKFLMETIAKETLIDLIGPNIYERMSNIYNDIQISSKIDLYKQYSFDIQNKIDFKFLKFISIAIDSNLLLSKDILLDSKKEDILSKLEEVNNLSIVLKAFEYPSKKIENAEIEYQIANYECVLLERELVSKYLNEYKAKNIDELTKTKRQLNYLGLAPKDYQIIEKQINLSNEETPKF